MGPEFLDRAAYTGTNGGSGSSFAVTKDVNAVEFTVDKLYYMRAQQVNNQNNWVSFVGALDSGGSITIYSSMITASSNDGDMPTFGAVDVAFYSTIDAGFLNRQSAGKNIIIVVGDENARGNATTGADYDQQRHAHQHNGDEPQDREGAIQQFAG